MRFKFERLGWDMYDWDVNGDGSFGLFFSLNFEHYLLLVVYWNWIFAL